MEHGEGNVISCDQVAVAYWPQDLNLTLLKFDFHLCFSRLYHPNDKNSKKRGAKKKKKDK